MKTPPPTSVITALLHKHVIFNSMFIHSQLFLIAVFPLISASVTDFISKFLGITFIIGQCLKDDDPHFKVREANCVKFQNLDIVFFKMKMTSNTSQQTKRFFFFKLDLNTLFSFSFIFTNFLVLDSYFAFYQQKCISNTRYNSK